MADDCFLHETQSTYIYKYIYIYIFLHIICIYYIIYIFLTTTPTNQSIFYYVTDLTP